ncbi:hypothetical protein GOV08_01365 [Candidatus Woesearchaeota archaeon]|nr:hypothetical protein [Candidatus Woesearchaeota archaeon]
MKKRGQISSQVMIYAFAIIVGGLIIFLGYKGISSFGKLSQESKLKTFEVDFLKETQAAASNFGSVKELTYGVPSNYETFCAFDMSRQDVLGLSVVKNNPLIADSLRDKNKNVFLIGNKDIFGVKADYIKFDKFPYYYCNYNIVNGVFKFEIKGAVIDAQSSALIIILSKVEKIIETNIALSQEIVSSDGLIRIEIPPNTKIDPPSINLSIEIKAKGDFSETYEFGPEDATFDPYLVFYIKSQEGCSNSKDFRLGSNTYHPEDPCNNDYFEYHIFNFSEN